MLLALASVAAITLAGCSKDPGKAKAESTPELRSLTIEQVAARIAAPDGKTFIYDNNPKASWLKGHVPGAKWLDDEHVTAADLPTDMAATLIFYCHSET